MQYRFLSYLLPFVLPLVQPCAAQLPDRQSPAVDSAEAVTARTLQHHFVDLSLTHLPLAKQVGRCLYLADRSGHFFRPFPGFAYGRDRYGYELTAVGNNAEPNPSPADGPNNISYSEGLDLVRNALLQNLVFSRITRDPTINTRSPRALLPTDSTRILLDQLEIPTIRERLYGLVDIYLGATPAAGRRERLQLVSNGLLKTFDGNGDNPSLGGLRYYVLRRFRDQFTLVSEKAAAPISPGTPPPLPRPEQIGHPNDLGSATYSTYLIAIDPQSGGIFFVSGEDIGLSEILRYYAPYGQRVASIAEWPLPILLEYLYDRLFAFNPAPLSEADISERNADRLVLLTPGKCAGRPCRLRVTLEFADPERVLLAIE